MSNQNIKTIFDDKETKKSLVAFIDILGFQKKVEEDMDNAMLLTILMNQYAKHKPMEFQVYVFSDCLYIICDIEKFDELVEMISNIQYALMNSSPMLLNGKTYELSDINLMRGGIAYGEVMVLDGINNILGEAVNKAYNLECRIAKYPRVILDECLCDKVSLEFFVQDESDGIYYLDFLKLISIQEPSGNINSVTEEGVSYLSEAINNVTDNYKEDDKEVTIEEKMKWFLDYLENKICKK